MGEGGSQIYQYLIILFFTLSVEGGRGKLNDTNFTLSAVFFLMSSLSWSVLFATFLLVLFSQLKIYRITSLCDLACHIPYSKGQDGTEQQLGLILH